MSGLQKLIFGLSLTVVTGPAFAGVSHTPNSRSNSGITDVVLSTDAGLSGRFIDGEGQAVDGALVTLSRQRTVVDRTSTDSSGAYHFPQVQQGVYQLTLGTQTQTIRVWSPQLAPPAALATITTVRTDQIIRGQFALISASTMGAVGGVAGVAGAGASGYSVMQSMDAQDEADAAVKEAAYLREMLDSLMSP
jgi:hypothetical protein